MGKCNHSNPPYHAFCVICGENLSRSRCPSCRAMCDSSFAYCSQCGCSLSIDQIADTKNNSAHAIPAEDYTYDLQALVSEASSARLESIKSKDRATQDDIKAMLKLRKKELKK